MAVFSMTIDHLTLYADVYTTNDCTGTATAYKSVLIDKTQGCTWSYTTSSIPAIAQSSTTLAKTNDWVTTNYYNTAAACLSKALPQYVYQGEVAVTTPCQPSCTLLNSNGNGFYEMYQACVYNAAYAPTAAPVPTQSPTNVTENRTAIISGSVLGGVLLIAVLAGLYFCVVADDRKKEVEQYERMQAERA